MPPTIFEFEQYSSSWWQTRRGVPTASEFHRVITPKKAELAAAADGYACQLLGDLYDPEYPRIDRATNDAMLEGTRREPESRAWYEFHTGLTVRQVGFVVSACGRWGSSPDGLVGEDGAVELKNPGPATQVKYLLAGTLPDEYRAQVHGHLVVSEREWVDWVSYCPGLPGLIVRVHPDEFTAKLRAALEQFSARLEEFRALLRAKEAA